MPKPVGYSVAAYGNMITDKVRMRAYARALEMTVRPGSVVLDIGAGTGIFSLIACQLGATTVHAVEPDDSIQVARAIASANGYAERLHFHQKLSIAVTLPEPADVVVSDLRGVLPLLQTHIPTIIDARHRLLAPHGILIPRCDSLWAAVVDDPAQYQRYIEPWLQNDYSLDMSTGQAVVVNTWRRTHISADRLLVTPQRWAELDYTTIESADVRGELSWVAERPGQAHALVVWFDTVLAPGIGFSNAPGAPETVYGQAFFPLRAPVALAAGDTIRVDLRADLVGQDYVWQWRTQVRSPGYHGTLRAEYRQSTFFGTPFSPANLRRRETGFRPQVGLDGEIEIFLLGMMDGGKTVQQIAKCAAETFPEQFPDLRSALAHVGELSLRYSR